MEMSKVTATSEQILRQHAGSILAVAFAGKYPPGSDGNECAAEMVAYVRSVLSTTNAAAVIFDLRNLNYTWGDAICGLALALLEEHASFRPSSIVATGPTARALEPLLSPKYIFGVAGTKMFGNMPDAVGHLERVLKARD
jgi:hypothetical protein